MIQSDCEADSRESRKQPAIPTLLLFLFVIFAAFIIDPQAGPDPFSDRRLLLYLLIVALAAAAHAFWQIRYSQARPSQNRQVAVSLLVAMGPGLFLVRGVSIKAVVLVFAVATVGTYAVHCRTSGGNGACKAATIASPILLLWLAIVGINSMYVGGRVYLPTVAVATIAAAALVMPQRIDDNEDVWPAILMALIGAELAFSLHFMKIGPVTSATMWLIGTSLVFMMVVIPRSRLVR